MNQLNGPLLDNLQKWGGVGLIALGIFVLTAALVGDRTGVGHRYWARYTSTLDRKLRTMFIWTPGRVIATVQIGVLFAMTAIHFAIPEGIPLFPVWLLLASVAPIAWIENERAKRKIQIEAQLDGFILALANALKAIPSVAAAFNSVVPILQPPIREEVELATKEMKVGSTLDQALLHMAARIGSKQVDSALSAILIGRQVGGNLGKVLETTAAGLREMARLEGVIKTKTAEGKMQLWVIGAMPAGIWLLMNFLNPGFFDPMSKSTMGYLLTGVAGAFWIGALILARKVLAVDI